MPRTKEMRRRDNEQKARKLEEKRALNEQIAPVEARARGGIVGGALAMTDAEMDVSTPGEEQVLESRGDVLTGEVEGEKGRKGKKGSRHAAAERRGKKHAGRRAYNADTEAENGAGGVSDSPATATEDIEMTTSAQEEEDVSQIQAEALAEEVEGKKRKKKGKGRNGKKSGGDDMEEVGETKETDETLRAPDDLPAPRIGGKKSKKARKQEMEEAMQKQREEDKEGLLCPWNLANKETIPEKPEKPKKKGKQTEGHDTESDRTVEDDSVEEARKSEEALKADADRKAQEEAEEAERKRLRRNEKSKEYKRKKAGEKRLEAAQKKVQDTLATTMANLGMSPPRSQSLELNDWRTRGKVDAEKATVDLTEYEPGIDEEWMKLLQDSAPDDQRLGDESDADWDDVDSDEAGMIHNTALGRIFDDGNVSRPMEKMNDFMKQIYSTFQDAASLLTTSNGPSSGPPSRPPTPPKKVRPPRNLQQDAHHFSHSHPFYSDGAWIHTISDRRAYQRDVYDYLRAKGFPREEIYSDVMPQLKYGWMHKFRPEEYDDNSDGSAFGDREIDDSEAMLVKLQDSIKANMTPSSKRKWDQAEASNARNNGGEEHDVDGSPSTGKRRKSVTFAKDVKNADGGSTLIPRYLRASKKYILTDGKESASPDLNDIIEDLMEKETKNNAIQGRDAKLNRRRETRKKIQKEFKKSKAASWVSERRSAEAETRNIADTSMNVDMSGATPVAAPHSMEEPKHGVANTSMNEELPASSWFTGHRSLVVNKGDIADTSMSVPLKQMLSRDYHTTIRQDSTENPTMSSTAPEEDEEELILPNTDVSSPSRRQRALVSRIDVLAEGLKAKASQFKGQQAIEAPKKKRKRTTNSTDDNSLTLIIDQDDLKEKVVNIEDTENADRKKKRKKRKSGSANNGTVDFLTPMIQEA